MLNISGLDNGIVLDHIPAGMSMEIYKYLNLGKLDSQVAIIKNASSKKMGKKPWGFLPIFCRNLIILRSSVFNPSLPAVGLP